MLLPRLSEADPLASSEGSIDPLGMYAIADALAMQLVPGVRERMQRPRFVTAIAVSTAICSEFGEDVLAADGLSEPWQVFEWHLVEGLVRTCKDKAAIQGLPGSDKANSALRDMVSLSAGRYLKTPSVYGYHGVYRLLAENVDIVVDGRLGEAGCELLMAWMREQRLRGFWGSADGPGRWWRESLTSAVSDGLEKGSVDRSGGWRGWGFFRDHLVPAPIGQDEAQFLFDRLVGSQIAFRGQVLRFLVSDEGQRVWRESEDERVFHQALRPVATPPLVELLDAIDVYERFSRFLDDAFSDCLVEMTRHGGKTPLGRLARLESVRRAAKGVPQLFPEVADRLTAFGENDRFHETFKPLAEPSSPGEWLDRFLEHHRSIQLRKPPNGKNPWFERYDDKSALIRPNYRRTEGADGDGGYVHYYRTNPLWSFVTDLGQVD